MNPNLSSLAQELQKILEVIRADLATIRTGKASPQLIEHIVLDAYGTRMKLLELATITAPDANNLVVTPFDTGNLSVIAKGIQEANLGLTALVEEPVVRVIVPPLSQERRGEYVKLAESKIEGGKVMVRQARHKAMEDAEKSNIDEDAEKLLEKQIQKLIDECVEKLTYLGEEKTKELMEV